MDVEPDAVAAAVGVEFAVAGGGDDVAGESVGLRAGVAGFDFCEGGFLGFENEVVDFLLFGGGFGGEDHAAHVAAVALVFHAHVDEDDRAFVQFAVGGAVVDDCGIVAEADDGVEAEVVSVVFVAEFSYFPSDVFFGERFSIEKAEVFFDYFLDFEEDFFVDGLAFFDEGDFVRGFDFALGFDFAAEVLEFYFGGDFFEALVFGEGDCRFFEAEDSDAVFF